jgi:hypothetical protein
VRRGANRIRNKADAEWEAYQEDEDWRYERARKEKQERAIAAGFQMPNMGDPFPPKQCPTCGAQVTLSAVDLHIEWHKGLSR